MQKIEVEPVRAALPQDLKNFFTLYSSKLMHMLKWVQRAKRNMEDSISVQNLETF